MARDELPAAAAAPPRGVAAKSGAVGRPFHTSRACTGPRAPEPDGRDHVLCQGAADGKSAAAAKASAFTKRLREFTGKKKPAPAT